MDEDGRAAHVRWGHGHERPARPACEHVWVNERINNAEGGVKVCARCGALGRRTPWF